MGLRFMVLLEGIQLKSETIYGSNLLKEPLRKSFYRFSSCITESLEDFQTLLNVIAIDLGIPEFEAHDYRCMDNKIRFTRQTIIQDEILLIKNDGISEWLLTDINGNSQLMVPSQTIIMERKSICEGILEDLVGIVHSEMPLIPSRFSDVEYPEF